MADSESQASPAPTGWRKRHPVLSRALLYSVLVIAAAVVVWLWLDVRNRKLRAQLRTLDVLSAQDTDGRVTLSILDEKFTGPFLPADVRRDVHRVRAFALAKDGHLDEALAELDAASALTRDALVQTAIRVERSQLRTWSGDGEGGLKELEAGAASSSSPTLTLFWSLARASALGELGRAATASSEIDEALESCPKPLPTGDALWIACTPYTPPEVARLATKALDELSAGGAPPAAWDRLLALAPDSFEAVLEATRAFLARQDRHQALVYWRQAIAVDSLQARKMEAAEPDLARLGDAAKNR